MAQLPKLPEQASRAPLALEDSLAGWLSRLGPGSPCFCCGSPLVPSAARAGGSEDGVALVCPACGVKIRDEVAAIAPAAFRRSRVALFAA